MFNEETQVHPGYDMDIDATIRSMRFVFLNRFLSELTAFATTGLNFLNENSTMAGMKTYNASIKVLHILRAHDLYRCSWTELYSKMLNVINFVYDVVHFYMQALLSKSKKN